jgi:hypothetical protein
VKLRELASPPAENWASALRALRLVNEQVLIDNGILGKPGGKSGPAVMAPSRSAHSP